MKTYACVAHQIETWLPPPPPRTKSLKILILCDKEGKARTEKDMDSSHDCKYWLAFKIRQRRGKLVSIPPKASTNAYKISGRCSPLSLLCLASCSLPCWPPG